MIKKKQQKKVLFATAARGARSSDGRALLLIVLHCSLANALMVGVVITAGIWDLALVFQPGAGRGSCSGWLQALGAVESETPGFGDPKDAMVSQQSAGGGCGTAPGSSRGAEVCEWPHRV